MKSFKLLASIAAISAVFGCASTAPSMTDGTYTGVGQGRNGELTVEVKVDAGKLSAVRVVKHVETLGISDAAVKQMPARIVDAQSLKVDAVSGATLTSEGIRTAVADAIRKAGGDPAAAADYSAELEMLHCYSLIHDDMPCMDNDDYRRGRLSCHKQYGEATALLAADALVTAAFEAVANAPTHPQSRVQAAAHLAKAAGARGMLYGQELDKHYETVHASESELLELHAHKTGALIIAGVDLGCDAAQADDALCTALQHYAAELGLVFQIVDDILDVTATTEELGKPVGSDAENDKTTFITLYGLEGARSLAKQHNDAALAALADLGPEADFLREMAVELLTRSK